VERGGDLVSTFPDGRVAIDRGKDESSVLSGSPKETDYTVSANATLESGSGYGVYVRATVDADTKLTGYAVQLDKTDGALLVNLVQSDVDVAKPIAQVAVPAGFAWKDPHTMNVTVKGNAMAVSLDGAAMIAIPDLQATAVKSSGLKIAAPQAGEYGLLAAPQAQVSLQQMTVADGD
jgi:hypothetical protein